MLFVIANCVLATAQTASSVLSQLTFEEPSKLYRVKGNTANMRKLPNQKAAKVEIKGKAYIVGGDIVNDLGDNPNWVKARIDGKVVYISKSVLTMAEQEPVSFASNYNIPFWYKSPNFSLEDGDISFQCWAWRMGKVYIDGFNYDYDFQPYGKWLIDSEVQYDNNKVYRLLVDKNTIKKVRIDDEGNTANYLDMTKITEPMVYALFKEVIDKDETDYFYLTSYSFNKKWPRNFD